MSYSMARPSFKELSGSIGRVQFRPETIHAIFGTWRRDGRSSRCYPVLGAERHSRNGRLSPLRTKVRLSERLKRATRTQPFGSILKPTQSFSLNTACSTAKSLCLWRAHETNKRAGREFIKTTVPATSPIMTSPLSNELFAPSSVIRRPPMTRVPNKKPRSAGRPGLSFSLGSLRERRAPLPANRAN